MITNYTTRANGHDELLQAYTAQLIFLGGSLSMSPVESDLPHVCDSGLLRNLPVASRNETYEKASRLLRSPCPHKQSCNKTVSDNYQSLLPCSSTSSAYPAASHWIKESSDEKSWIAELLDKYRKYGFYQSPGGELEPDHIGIQLLYVNLLIEKYLTEDEQPVKDIIRNDLLQFIDNHMLTWLPVWADHVSDKSVTKCYTGIAGLVIGSLEDIRELLEVRS